ncbi:hypothetical protein EJB05_29213, partial [Eragrostis curvula]
MTSRCTMHRGGRGRRHRAHDVVGGGAAACDGRRDSKRGGGERGRAQQAAGSVEADGGRGTCAGKKEVSRWWSWPQTEGWRVQACWRLGGSAVSRGGGFPLDRRWSNVCGSKPEGDNVEEHESMAAAGLGFGVELSKKSTGIPSGMEGETRRRAPGRGRDAFSISYHIYFVSDVPFAIPFQYRLQSQQNTIVVRNVNDESQVEMLKDIGVGIIEKCDGLPLAVKVMGGVLLQKNRRRSDWEAVLKDSVWSESLMPEELNNAVYLSYQDLDPPLKPCFLYFSLLPKSEVFNVHEIVGMWISEGIIHGNLDDLENIGREYYDELILRNLIEPNMRYVDQQVCNMHDVVRSFAQYIARDEALVAGQSSKIDITSKLNAQRFIRLSLENKGSESDELEWMSLQAQISVRTLISVGNNIKIKPGNSLVTFSSLRTLHVIGADFDPLAESLVKLKHLRYLSIADTNISILPENIDKMKFLQYIDISNCESLVKLPVSIGKLQDLRYLNLRWTSINSIPRGFGGLTSLRKLYGIPVHMDGEWCSLEELGPLSKLIELSIHGLENVSSSKIARKTNLCGKVHLRKLALHCTSKHGHNGQLFKEEDNISGQGHQNIEEVFDELCPPPSVEHLTINTYFGRRLPIWMTSSDVVPLGSLRIMVLEDLPCCTELPNSLCQLPCLEFLQIERAPAIKRVGPEFLQLHHHEHLRKLEVIECSGIERISNLPKLQELLIANCPKLKVLEGVPALERLHLVDYDMGTLPGYLQDVNPRHLLEIDCDVSLLTSMAMGKSSPEWDKFSHIKQVKAYAHDNDKMKWYVSYIRDPFSFKTNISRSAIKQGPPHAAPTADASDGGKTW